MITSVFTDELSRDPKIAIAAAKKMGIPKLELRNVGTGRVPAISAAEMRALLEELGRTSLEVTSLSPGIGKCSATLSDVETVTDGLIDASIRFAREVGARKITLFAFRRAPGDDRGAPLPDALVRTLRKAIERIAAAGIIAAVENWQSSYASTVESVGELLECCRGLPLMVDFDPCNAWASGGSLTALPFPDRLSSIHVKDARHSALGTVHAPLGLGEVDWPTIIRLLKRSRFSGDLVLESHAPEDQLQKAAEDHARFNELWRRTPSSA
jgi:sugar phosphate isomerase/epimerase